jgi:hypothetical protein
MLASGSPQSHPVLKHCVRLIIPGMIRFVAETAAESNGEPERSGNKKQALDEICKAFSSFFGIVPEDQKPRMLGILLPTFMLLLAEPGAPSPDDFIYHSAGIRILLQIASIAPGAFKEATSQLDPQQRTVLESAVREALAGGASSNSNRTAKPTIALRNF